MSHHSTFVFGSLTLTTETLLYYYNHNNYCRIDNTQTAQWMRVKIHHDRRHDSCRFFHCSSVSASLHQLIWRSVKKVMSLFRFRVLLLFYDFKLQLILSMGHWHYLRFLISFSKDTVQTGKHFEADWNEHICCLDTNQYLIF